MARPISCRARGPAAAVILGRENGLRSLVAGFVRIRTFGHRIQSLTTSATSVFAVTCLGVAAYLLTLPGCGKNQLQTKVVHGTITFQGDKVDTGVISFVPIDGTPGPTTGTMIDNGQYRIDTRGGVPVGKHRVEIDARKKTGNQVEEDDGSGLRLVDETVTVGPPHYAGDQSPLVMEVTADSDGRIDIEIPNE